MGLATDSKARLGTLHDLYYEEMTTATSSGMIEDFQEAHVWISEIDNHDAIFELTVEY